MTATQRVYQRLVVGEQLGHLEYLVTPEKLALFQDAVEYPQALFPSIAVEEYRHVLRAKHGCMDCTSVKHADRYFHPPVLGLRVQVTGWVRDKYQQQDLDWLVVETFAVDEIGRELVRSEHVLLVGGGGQRENPVCRESPAGAAEHLPPFTRTVTQEKIDRFGTVGKLLVSDSASSGTSASIQNDAGRAQQMVLPQAVASDQLSFSYIHELMARRFGADFRQGGRLSVTFIKRVDAGDTLTARGIVTSKDSIEHRTRYTLQVWQQDQHGEKTSVGNAQVIVPSPLT